MFPMGHVRRMHPVGTGSLIDGFEPFERFERHTGFELCAVLFPLCRHRPCPPLQLLLTQPSILITCPVFGVHYSVGGTRPREPSAADYANSSNNAFASFKSAVSKP